MCKHTPLFEFGCIIFINSSKSNALGICPNTSSFKITQKNHSQNTGELGFNMLNVKVIYVFIWVSLQCLCQILR